ncbi:hypothetical protein CesoFtcFv8_022069 [Champsocephalus esox]|uniref:Uncharacterized protein n=1 Tax=Champsocephalus esox TaxID=159716 RepID=A0AAN8BB42_9TELE|nr:hypothetical protein CesoFtcFv8_022069 [Champsocephalus esox]
MVWIWVEEKVSNGSPSAFMAVKSELDRAKPPVSREKGRGYGQHETQQLLRPSLLRPEELSMESGIDPGQEYYAQDYYNYDHGYELPQYGSRRKLIPPSGLYDEYGEVVVDDDGSYYYSPQESEGEPGNRKRRIKLVVDREYETSSTGEESLPETQRSRLPPTLNSHSNVNGSIYLAQNGSIIRTRRTVNATCTTHTHSTTMNNNLKIPSPVFSSRLAKHFKKLDKMAATLEERVPLNNPLSPADSGGNTLRTFQSSGMIASATATSSFSNTDNNKTLSTFNTRQSSASLESSTSNTGADSVESKSNLLREAQSGRETPQGPGGREELGEGERETQVDVCSEDAGLVVGEPLECPSDRTLSDEEELWMGPWNSLHIPMTKL